METVINSGSDTYWYDDQISELTKKVNSIPVNITPEQYNAVGNGTANDTMSIQNAINKAIEKNLPLYLQNKYLITEQLFIESPIKIYGEGQLIYGGSNSSDYSNKSFITFGKQSAITSNYDIQLNITQNTNNNYKNVLTGINGITALNVAQSVFNVRIRNFNSGFILCGDGKDCDYNTIYPEYITCCQKAITLQVKNNGACNQNNFFGGSCRVDSNFTDLIDSYYSLYTDYDTEAPIHIINNNSFFGTSFEYPANKKNKCYVLIKGQRNSFYSCRYENVIIQDYKSRSNDYFGNMFLGGYGLSFDENSKKSSMYQDNYKGKYYFPIITSSEGSETGLNVRASSGNVNLFRGTYNNEDTCTIDSDGDITTKGVLEFQKTVVIQAPENPPKDPSSKNFITRKNSAATEQDSNNTVSGGIYINGQSASHSVNRFYIKDRDRWENILYTYPVLSTIPTDSNLISGQMIFDMTNGNHRPLWCWNDKGNIKWVDATGNVVYPKDGTEK